MNLFWIIAIIIVFLIILGIVIYRDVFVLFIDILAGVFWRDENSEPQ